MGPLVNHCKAEISKANVSLGSIGTFVEIMQFVRIKLDHMNSNVNHFCRYSIEICVEKPYIWKIKEFAKIGSTTSLVSVFHKVCLLHMINDPIDMVCSLSRSGTFPSGFHPFMSKIGH